MLSSVGERLVQPGSGSATISWIEAGVPGGLGRDGSDERARRSAATRTAVLERDERSGDDRQLSG